MDQKVWKKQIGEMEKVVKEVEGDDRFREYAADSNSSSKKEQ